MYMCIYKLKLIQRGMLVCRHMASARRLLFKLPQPLVLNPMSDSLPSLTWAKQRSMAQMRNLK